MVESAANPRAGKQYPGTWREFRAWFGEETSCIAYLELLYRSLENAATTMPKRFRPSRALASWPLQLGATALRQLPHYHQFDHGYAITAHRSQGKTVDGVILSADAMKQELFCLGASCGRREIVIITSDRELLRESLGISSLRPTATELAREQTRHGQPEHSIQKSSGKSHEPPTPRHEISLGLGL